MGEGRPPTVHGHQLPPQLLEGGGASASLTLALCGTGHTFFKGDSSHLLYSVIFLTRPRVRACKSGIFRYFLLVFVLIL